MLTCTKNATMAAMLKSRGVRSLLAVGGLCGAAVGVERSVGALDAAEAPGAAHAVIAAVRFTRALAAASVVMADYRLLFVRHKEYSSAMYKEERSRVHERSANRMLQLCRQQGSVYVKVGQHIASMTYGVPPEYSKRMRELEDHAAHRPYAQIRRMLAREIPGGADAFERFDHVPVAAASLAQVHRARVKGASKDVAVKVQYPGLEALISSDLKTISVLSTLITKVFPSVSLDWIVRQFRRNLHQELDFTNEARSAVRAKHNMRGERRISVPAVYNDLSTKRLLTMEYVDGVRVDDVDKLTECHVRPEAVAAAIVDAFARMMFIDGFVHGDAHAGNILVCPKKDGEFEVALLDHGLYHEMDDEFRKAYCRLWRGLVLRRTKDVEEACRALGAPGLANVFSIFLLNRTWDSARQIGTDIRNKMSREEMRELRQSVRQYGVISETDIGTLMEELPDDFLLVAKMNSLVRNVNRSLGAGVNRFKVNARFAVRGLAHENGKMELKTLAASGVEGWVVDGLAAVGRRVGVLLDIVQLELNLLALDSVLAFFSALKKWQAWWAGEPPAAEVMRIG